MLTLIDRFEGDWGFLSNFYPSTVLLDGVAYPSVENAYQAAKTLNLKEREKFINITAGQAKRVGAHLRGRGLQREDWFDVSLSTMRELLEQKFTPPFSPPD